MLQTFFVAILFVGIRCDSEVQREIILFDKVDTDNDRLLNRADLDHIFELFDVDNDTEVHYGEFEKDWTSVYNIGGPQEAQALFHRADTNDDNVIDAKDLPDIFNFFDKDKSGLITLDEFLTQWGVLKNSPAQPVDVSIQVG